MSGFHPYQAVLRQQLEMRELEEVFEQDDIKCESMHETVGPGCSIEVTHLSGVSCGGTARRVCTNAAHNNEAYRQTHEPCVYCKNDAFDCWKIRPI